MAQGSNGFRIEHDTMGEVRVPATARWGAQTQRAVENFPISGYTFGRELVAALASVKGAMATEKLRRRMLDKGVAKGIHDAAAEVARGEHDDQFPLDVFQTGSGTSTNMNVNEVLAALAGERAGRSVHPNDDVNAPLSSNDQFPSAVQLAACRALEADLLPALALLARSLRRKTKDFATVVKSGRTHLMDATPVTLGQEFGGYATQVTQSADRLRETMPRLGSLPLGGSAVGTGINVPKGFAAKVIALLAADTGLPLTEARDHMAAQAAPDVLVEVSGQLRALAVALVKIANDVRWMGSGPRCGLGEVMLPDLQPGSSIMPGKVNPVIPEAVTQVAAQVIGNDATVAFGGSQGAFELNPYGPVMAHNLLESIRLLANVTRLFATRCIDGIEADVEQCHRYAESSPSIGTALNPALGYERAAEVIKESVRTGKSIRQIVVERKLMTNADVDRALDIVSMTRGGVAR